MIYRPPLSLSLFCRTMAASRKTEGGKKLNINKDAKIHELKTWPGYFHALAMGHKTFEVRMNDRDITYGDLLILKEYDPEKNEFSGAAVIKKVSYILSDPQFVKEGYVILGLSDD